MRRIRYDGDTGDQQGGAIGWLKRIADGRIEPNLPVKLDQDNVAEQTIIRHGSQTKRENSW